MFNYTGRRSIIPQFTRNFPGKLWFFFVKFWEILEKWGIPWKSTMPDLWRRFTKIIRSNGLKIPVELSSNVVKITNYNKIISNNTTF